MLWLTVVLTPLALALEGPTSPPHLFAEGFEDTKLASRGWYDGDRFVLSDDAVTGKHAIQYRFAREADPADSAGVRHLLRAHRGRLPAFRLEALAGLVVETRSPDRPHLLQLHDDRE